MTISHHAILVLAALTAAVGCTSTVAKDPKVNGGEVVADEKEKKPEEKKPEERKPEEKEALVDVAVGSVLLERDCPDPPDVAHPAPASVVPPASRRPVRPVSPGVTARSVPRKPGVAENSRTCRQSTLQITFDNRGTAPAEVSITEVTMRDVETDQVVAALPSRGPSKWSDADNAYAKWDQNIAATTSARTSYRIKPPSWSAVEAKLDGKPSRGRTYDVEVSLRIDGVPATARSAEFTRPPIVPMPPT